MLCFVEITFTTTSGQIIGEIINLLPMCNDDLTIQQVLNDTNQPMSGVTVTVHNASQELLFTETTGSDGYTGNNTVTVMEFDGATYSFIEHTPLIVNASNSEYRYSAREKYKCSK